MKAKEFNSNNLATFLFLTQEAIILARLVELIVSGDLSWQRKFDFIFSDKISERLDEIFNEINFRFSWVNPDMDYEDDVRAYSNALAEAKEDLLMLRNNLEIAYREEQYE